MKPPLVILCGGKGTRLHSVTQDKIQKCMVPIGERPFLYWLIKYYQKQGFDNISLQAGHLLDAVLPIVKETDVGFFRDDELDPDYWYHTEAIIVNGDTWIPDSLPDLQGPWILTHNGVDAGAQRAGIGKIKALHCTGFFDIGTPEGLERFKRYFKESGYGTKLQSDR